MDDKELLQLYFDGELSGPEAEQAEKLLENDPEAASEFADLTAIRRACENERLAIAAPSDSRDKIFAAVGYSTLGLPYLIKRYSLIAGVALLVTVALYWAFNVKQDNKAGVKDNTEISSNSRPTAPPVISSKEIPQDNSVAAARPKARSGARVQRNYGSVTTAPSAETNAITQAPTQQAPYPAQDRRPELSRSTIAPTPMNHNALANAVSLFELLTIDAPESQAPKAPKSKNWSFTLRGSTPSNANVPFGKESSISANVLFWSFGKNITFGIEVGTIYFTRDSKDEASGDVSQISKNTVFGGLVVKYQINDWRPLDITPFLNATLGVHVQGTTMGRMGLGVQRSVFSDKLNLLFEYDYYRLFYKLQDASAIRSSGTHGLSAGLMYKF